MLPNSWNSVVCDWREIISKHRARVARILRRHANQKQRQKITVEEELDDDYAEASRR